MYASWTGTCKYVAKCYKNALEEAGHEVDCFDVSTPTKQEKATGKMRPSAEYDVIGCGSVIASQCFSELLVNYVEALDKAYFDGKKAFVFATAAGGDGSARARMAKMMQSRGSTVVHSYAFYATHNYPPLLRGHMVVITPAMIDEPMDNAIQLLDAISAGEAITHPTKLLAGIFAHVITDRTCGFFGKVTVDPEVCTGCEKCVRVCPSEAMTMVDGDSGKVAVKSGKCRYGCYACFNNCPVSAITKQLANPAKQPRFLWNDEYLRVVRHANLPKLERVSRDKYLEMVKEANAAMQ